jgi:hypothetical protein
MFVKSTDTVSGFYGGSNTPCNVFLAYCSDGLTWYAVEDSCNVNATYDPVEDGVNVETLLDVDCFICAIGIDSEKTLERALEA